MTTNFIAALATEEGTVDTDIRTLTAEQLRSGSIVASFQTSRASSPYTTFTDAQGNTWTDAQGNTWTLARSTTGSQPLLVLVDGLAAAHTIAEIRAAASDAKDIVES